MEATANLGATVAWCGFALGLVFGAVGSALGMAPVFGAISLCLAAGGYAASRKAKRARAR